MRVDARGILLGHGSSCPFFLLESTGDAMWDLDGSCSGNGEAARAQRMRMLG
jgi:hypothetical protein